MSGLVNGLVEGIAARQAIARLTTTEASYDGHVYRRKRSAIEQRQGDASAQIEQTEVLLDQCHATLLADSTVTTCPPERQRLILDNLRYVDRIRPTWDQRPYRQELRLYLDADARRRKMAGK